MDNLFSDNSVGELGVTFLHSGREFSYDIRYDTDDKKYIYEKFDSHDIQ